MKNSSRAFGFVGTVATLHFASVCEAGVTLSAQITWSLSEGGNGHAYQSALFDSVVGWSQANAHAIELGGHLVSLTSDAENMFVFNELASNPALWDSSPTPNADGPYFGAIRPGGIGGGPASGWEWVTGEVWGFTAWASGEPNGIPSGVQGSAYWSLNGPAPTWFDHPPSDTVSRSSIIEFVVPSPATICVLALCGRRWRRRTGGT